MPFHGETSGLIFKAILDSDPPPAIRFNRDIPPKLEDIINRALEKDRELRYQNAAEMRVELQRLKRDTETGRVPAASSGSTPAVPASETPARPSREETSGRITVPSLAVVSALIAGGLYYRSHRAKPLTDKDTIVLADFDQQDWRPGFRRHAQTGPHVSLNQSPFLSIVSEQRIQETLRLMNQTPDVRLVPKLALEVCQRTQSTAVLDGSVAQVGSEYLLIVKAVNCANGQSLASAEAQAADKNHVLEALNKVSVEIRSKLGESLATVEKYAAPVEQATTSSLEALQAYSRGLRLLNGGDSAALHSFFQTRHRRGFQLCHGLRLAGSCL